MSRRDTHTRLVFPFNSGFLVDFEYLAGLAVCSVSPVSRIVREPPPVSIHAETSSNVSDWRVGAKFSLSFQVHRYESPLVRNRLVPPPCLGIRTWSTLRASLPQRGPWGGCPGAHIVSSRIRRARSSLPRRRQGRGLGGADGLSLLKAPQSTQPKKPQRGGPVAQDQTFTQRAKPQGGRRARRPGPAVLPTQEASGREAGQSPRTSRPPNQRTEAGQTPRTSRPSNTRSLREVRRSPKESVTPESATRDQPRSQSLHQRSQRLYKHTVGQPT